MRLFINSLAASAGGGLTYIRNVIPHLAASPDLRVTVALSPSLRKEFPDSGNIEFLELETAPAKRFWFEQSKLPDLIRRARRGRSAIGGKLRVAEFARSANSAFTQFRVHLIRFLPGPDCPG